MQWNFMPNHEKCMNYKGFGAFLRRKSGMDPSKHKEFKGFLPRNCPISPHPEPWKSLDFN